MSASEDSGGEQTTLAKAAARLIEHLLEVGINGAGPFKGAIEVAEEHLKRTDDVELAVAALIRTHVRMAAATGGICGLGGLPVMPVAIPAGLTSLYVISTRMAAGVAHLRGYSVHSEEVRTAVLLCLLGSAGIEAAKRLGVEVGKKAYVAALGRLPGSVLFAINRAVGFRLITKFGEKGVINLGKAVPFIGFPVGAVMDGLTCRGIGKYASSAFPMTEARA